MGAIYIAQAAWRVIYYSRAFIIYRFPYGAMRRKPRAPRFQCKNTADGEEIAALNNAPANTQINTRLNQQKNHTPQRALFFFFVIDIAMAACWNKCAPPITTQGYFAMLINFAQTKLSRFY
jgi:hypothetical protein